MAIYKNTCEKIYAYIYIEIYIKFHILSFHTCKFIERCTCFDTVYKECLIRHEI